MSVSVYVCACKMCMLPVNNLLPVLGLGQFWRRGVRLAGKVLHVVVHLPVLQARGTETGLQGGKGQTACGTLGLFLYISGSDSCMLPHAQTVTLLKRLSLSLSLTRKTCFGSQKAPREKSSECRSKRREDYGRRWFNETDTGCEVL